jgi:hypothetical protein
VVTLCTTRFNVKEFFVLLAQFIYMFIWLAEQTAIIFLHNINSLVFITQRRCVYCAVRTESLNTIQTSHSGSSNSMPGQSMWDLWWTKWHWDRFLSEYFSFPLSVSFHHCSILIFIYILLLPEGQMGEAWEPSKDRCFFCNRGAFYRRVLSVSL